MKRGDGTWGTDDFEDKSVNTLYALTVLSLLDGSINTRYINLVGKMKETVKQRVSQDRKMLLPYVLGLYLEYANMKEKRSTTLSELKDLLEKAEREWALSKQITERVSYSLEYLFSISTFFDLLRASLLEDIPNHIRGRFEGLIRKISSQFEELDDRSKAKLLYALSVSSALKTELQQIYRSYAKSVEDLKNAIKEEDYLALLIKPYMTLGVECNRVLLFRLVDYFQKESQYRIQERELCYRLGQSLIYMDTSSKTGVEIRSIDENHYQILIDVTSDTLDMLRRQAPSVQFVSRIILWLGLAGFRYTYTVPEGELETYREFLKEQRVDRYVRVNKQGIEEILRKAVNTFSNFNLLKATNLFILAAVISYVVSYISKIPTLIGTLVGSGLWAISIEILRTKVPESYIAFFSTIFGWSKMKKQISKELKSLLEVS